MEGECFGISHKNQENLDVDNVEATINTSTTIESFEINRSSSLLKKQDTASFVANSINNSKKLSIFLLVNSMIGSGIFNQPYVFFRCGILGAFLIYIPATYFTWLGLVTLAEVCNVVGVIEYESAAQFAFGRYGEIWFSVSLFFVLFGGELSYFILLGQIISELFKAWGCSSSIGCGQYLMTFIFGIGIVLPISLFRHFGHLGYLAMFSMVMIFACVGLVLIGGPLTASSDQMNEPATVINGYGILTSGFGSIVFSLACAPFSLHVLVSSKIEDQSIHVWKYTTLIAVLLGLALCLIMGLSGYLSFRENTQPFILENFPQNWAYVFFVFLVIHLLLYIPGDLIVLRYNFVKVFFNGARAEDLPEYQNRIITIFILFCILGTVMGIISSGSDNGTSFSLVLDITGGVAASSISFIIPSFMYLKTVPLSKQRYRIPAMCNAAFGISITCIVIATIISTPFVSELVN